MNDLDELLVTRSKSGLSRENAYAVRNGVSVDWLSRVFRRSPVKINNDLKYLKVVAVTSTGTALYNLEDACRAIVKPEMALDKYLQEITVDMLPDKLKEPFWNAKLKEQRYRRNAGDLWRTESVVQVFGAVLKDIKERIRLFPDVVTKTALLSPEQTLKIQESINQLQADIYAHIQSLESKTQSSISELNNEFDSGDDPDYKSVTEISRNDSMFSEDFDY